MLGQWRLCSAKLKPQSMAIFKTLLIHRRQILHQYTHVFNSLRRQCASFNSQAILEPNLPVQIDDDGDKVCELKVKEIAKVKKQKEKAKERKPLHMMFGEAVGLMDVREMSEGESEDERYMIKNLKKLEKEISRLKEGKAEEKIGCLEDSTSGEKVVKSGSLSALYTGKNVKRDQRQNFVEDSNSDAKMVKPVRLSGLFSGENVKRDHKIKRDVEMEAAAPVTLKKLSAETLMFIEVLYKGGYFRDANFLPGNTFDASYFDDSYSREYIKFAADMFAKDHHGIARWLSGSQVKTVALYGCPTRIKKTIFAAKRLRSFFRIQEDTVCSRCVLRESCKFVNQSVWNGDSKNLNLEDTMKVIILYALEAVHPKLPLPYRLKSTVNLLLKDMINLSKTTS
ncbi:unnamed protein product [Rhodiola kirilowii]